MIRDSYSYWITVTAPSEKQIEKFNHVLEKKNIVPDILVGTDKVTFQKETNLFRKDYEVDPNCGTVEFLESDMEHIQDAIAEAAEADKQLSIWFDAVNEDDASQKESFIWQNGNMTHHAVARTVETDNEYDKYTIEACARLAIENPNLSGKSLAGAIREMFKTAELPKP